MSPHSANIDCAKVEQQCGGILTPACCSRVSRRMEFEADEVGEQWNVFEPLPGRQVDLRTRHGVTPGEARSVGYRTQPRRVVALGEEGHRVWGGRRLARRRSVAR